MKVLVLCGATPNEWQLEFARLLGHALHERRCTCLVGGYTPFVQELVSSGVPCTGYTIEPQEEMQDSTVKCASLCLDDSPTPEEVWGIRMGLFLAEPDAYILVGKSEGLEGTLLHLSPLLAHNKARKQPKPFVLAGWGLIEQGHIRSIFGIPAYTKEQKGEERHPLNGWLTDMPAAFAPKTIVRIALSTLGLSDPAPTPS